jgi:hypothetical protein
MGKKNESGAAPLALANKIKRFDYDRSVAKMRPLLRQWKRATEEMLRELYLAREYLTGQKGQHRDPEADDYITHTWGGYCGELGISTQAANAWLKPFTPRELSDNGRDFLMLEAPLKTETTSDRALMEARVQEVLRTGKRPKNWTDKEEAELKKQLENARFREMAEKLNAPVELRTKTDYFAAALKKSKDVTNFKLEDRVQIMAQAMIFDDIEEYLKSFADIETRTLAAFNLALKTRNLANDIADMNFQLTEAQPPKEQADG